MKKISRSLLAVLAVLGVVAAMAMPASALPAGAVQSTWLNYDNNANYCGYAMGGINTLATGSQQIAWGSTYHRTQTGTCTPGTGDGQALPANYLYVQVSVQCRGFNTATGVGGTPHTEWTGNQNANDNGVGNVTGGITAAALESIGDHCFVQQDLNTIVQRRTHVLSGYWVGGLAPLTYTRNTEWLNDN